jgi:hypothetical protein
LNISSDEVNPVVVKRGAARDSGPYYFPLSIPSLIHERFQKTAATPASDHLPRLPPVSGLIFVRRPISSPRLRLREQATDQEGNPHDRAHVAPELVSEDDTSDKIGRRGT